jgi:hypothetical protein
MRHWNWLEGMARVGYAARGIVYIIIGGFAALAALGARARTVGTRGAFETLLAQPLGDLLLWIVAAGFLCFAVWRLLQSIFDADRCGAGRKALLRRTAQGISALFYVGLAVWAVSLVFTGPSSGSEDQEARDWTRWLLGQPLGRWIAVGIGIGIAGVGIGSAVTGLSSRIKDRLDLGPDARASLVLFGRLGFLARAVLFGMIGCLLVFAAWHSDATEMTGLKGALQTLRQQSYGAALLGAAAAGLLGFGLFQLVQATFRRVDAPEPREIAAKTKAAAEAAAG